MGPSPTYHPPKGEECETLVEHGLPLWAEPAVGCCSRRPRPSPVWGSCFVGARAVGPRVGERKPLGKTPLRGNPSPESTYLPTSPPPSLEKGGLRPSAQSPFRRRRILPRCTRSVWVVRQPRAPGGACRRQASLVGGGGGGP